MERAFKFSHPLSRVRFDFRGQPVGVVPSEEARGKLLPKHVLQRDVLRVDSGEVPEGYALPEVVVLMFSSVPRQRVVACQMVSTILQFAAITESTRDIGELYASATPAPPKLTLPLVQAYMLCELRFGSALLSMLTSAPPASHIFSAAGAALAALVRPPHPAAAPTLLHLTC